MDQALQSPRDPEKQHLTRTTHSEHDIATAYLGNFRIEGSEAQQFLWELTEQKILMQESVRTIAEILSMISDIPFPRDFKRTRILTMKWIEDNLTELRVFKSWFGGFDLIKNPPALRERRRQSESD
jgi:hypothetical protein